MPPRLVFQVFGQVAGENANRAGVRLDGVGFNPAVGVVLDVLQAQQARVREAARVLGISTANLLAFLQASPKVWEQANLMRAQFGHKPLRSS